MEIRLVGMSAEEFAGRIAVLEREYAEDLRTARGMTADEALAEAARQLATILPEGVHTESTLLWTAEADGQTVGWLWVTLPGAPGRPETAWIHNIEVDPAHQSKGHGSAMVRAVEAELAARGVTRLGLNVFGHNARAVRLYERLGFHVTAQQMAKTIEA